MEIDEAIRVIEEEIKICENRIKYFRDTPLASKENQDFMNEQTEIIIRKQTALSLAFQALKNRPTVEEIFEICLPECEELIGTIKVMSNYTMQQLLTQKFCNSLAHIITQHYNRRGDE